MKTFTDNEIKKIFSNICCSRCKNDFVKESLKILNQKGDLYICNLTCQKCGKDFGIVVFCYKRGAKNHPALEIIDGPPPITSDDVIDAHKFIRENL